MYPLNVSLPAGDGYAVANDAAEHARLSTMGYLPALAEEPPPPPSDEVPTVESVRAKLDALGIAYHHRAGLEKLLSLVPA